ncbi:protein BIIDXI-like [Typha latifolia]|uniref:protein BIIDXI-like n=1 Tax=Typha latifolia TaxID=4733 RepID=UPI003C2CC5B4
MGESSTRSTLCFISLLLLSQFVSAAVEDGLLNNGDFETAPAGGFASAVAFGDGNKSLPGWTINGTVELISSGQKQGGMILIVPQGEHAVRLGNDAEIAQVVELEKGSEYSVTFSAARTCAQLESLNLSVGSASQTVDLQTLYSVEGWDAYSWAFQAAEEEGRLAFKNPGMEDDPTCGPVIDNIAVKKLFTPDRSKDNVAINGDFEEGPWMFPNATLGVLLPTNLNEETSSLPGWIIESNRAVRYIDSDHYTVPQGKRAIELLSGKEGIISQMVETIPQKQYSLTFTLGSAGDSCQPPMAITAFAGDQTQNFHYSPTGNATRQAANLTFMARAERSRIAFYSIYYNTRSDDRSSLCGPVVDEVNVWGLSGSTGLKARGALFLGLVLAVVASLLA